MQPLLLDACATLAAAGQGRTGLLATAPQAASFDAVIFNCIQSRNVAIHKHCVAVLLYYLNSQNLIMPVSEA